MHRAIPTNTCTPSQTRDTDTYIHPPYAPPPQTSLHTDIPFDIYTLLHFPGLAKTVRRGWKDPSRQGWAWRCCGFLLPGPPPTSFPQGPSQAGQALVPRWSSLFPWPCQQHGTGLALDGYRSPHPLECEQEKINTIKCGNNNGKWLLAPDGR